MPKRPDRAQVRHGIEGLDEDLARQRRLVGDSNEVYARLLGEVEAVLCGPNRQAAIVERLARAWRSRAFSAFYERPLLLLAALRFDAISSPHGHPLAEALRSEDPDPRFISRDRVVHALGSERLVVWLALATRKVQTNDVSRAVSWRWPASMAGTRPIVLVDIGCAAGLNLIADALPWTWTRTDGVPFEVSPPNVLDRVGFDKEPLRLSGEDEASWLRACIWPGDHERLRRLDQAIEAHRGRPPRIERVSARYVVSRLRRIEQAAPSEALVLAYQTFVRDYVDADERKLYDEQLDAWLTELAPGRALMMQLELAADEGQLPAELVARPSAYRPLQLARCSYHPATLDVNPSAAAELQTSLSP